MVTAVGVAQVVFDIIMAPTVADPHAAHHEERAALPNLDEEKQVRARAEAQRRRYDPSRAKRKGTPSELRRDLYFHFIEGSWTGLFASLAVVFLFGNLVFAKTARPKAAVLFSESIVITRREGMSTLMFRVGNARGNEVAEASVRVTLLQDEVSPEGHRMRRFYDLELERNTIPLITWTVMHRIDAASLL